MKNGIVTKETLWQFLLKLNMYPCLYEPVILLLAITIFMSMQKFVHKLLYQLYS